VSKRNLEVGGGKGTLSQVRYARVRKSLEERFGGAEGMFVFAVSPSNSLNCSKRAPIQ